MNAFECEKSPNLKKIQRLKIKKLNYSFLDKLAKQVGWSSLNFFRA